MSTPSFLEGTPIGGFPWFAKMIHDVMPKSKRKREAIYRIQMVILTYLIYSLFNMTRRPLSIVKSRILNECDYTHNRTFNKSGTWCDEAIYLRNPEQFLGLMDFLFTFSYGVCLYVSGVVADCYNPRYYLTTGCFLSGYFCALLGLCDYWNLRSFKFLGTMCILHGASQSTAWPVVLSSVTHWYGVVGKRRGMFFGFWNTHNYLGSMIGILISVQWVDGRWMWSFFVPGFILAFAGIFVFSCMLAHPKDFKLLDKEKSLAIRSRSASIERRRSRQEEVPTWLSTKSSITMYEAWTLPGVIEFSTCMFFSRMVGYTFLFWLPVFLQSIEHGSASRAAYYSLAYVVGGSCGGIVAGVLVDLTRQSAIVCAFFLIISMPTLLLGLVPQFGKVMQSDFPLFLVIGIFVEAPYVVISTSVSADLGTHRMVKRNHRAISTVGGIIEGTGAIGASLGTLMSGIILAHSEWTTILYVLVACQFLALVCLSRQVYTEFYRKPKTEEEEINYLKLPLVG